MPFYYLREGRYVFIVVCLSVSNFAQKLPNTFAWNFQEGWQWANEQMVKFWWRIGSPSGFVTVGRYGKWYQSTALHNTAVLGRHCHSNYNIITSPALSGGMHCPSESALFSRLASYLSEVANFPTSRVFGTPIWCAHIGIQKARILGYHVALFLWLYVWSFW